MAGTVKKLRFSEGTDVGAPTDLGLATSTTVISAFADDTAYETSEGPGADGSTYINTTNKVVRYYSGTWRSSLPAQDSTDATKTVALSFSAQGTGRKTTLAFSAASTDKTATFPNITGQVAVFNSNDLDVPSAGNSTIGGNVGANNLTLGGSSSTVVIPGNLLVSGTTTTINTTDMDVKDKNVTLNKGGNDASAEGAGLTVERTGTNGSIVYEDALASKWKAGALGSESELITAAATQTMSNKSFSNDTVLKAASAVQFNNTANTFSTKIRADGAATANTDYKLPPGYPASSGQVLSSTTGGVMSWVSASGLIYEIVSNTDSGIPDADETTSVSGMSAGIIGVQNLTSSSRKTVEFSDAHQDGDQFIIVCREHGFQVNMHGVIPVNNAGLDVAYAPLWQYGGTGANTVGIGIEMISGEPTLVNVVFGRFATLQSTGAGTGGEWGLTTSTTEWGLLRIRTP